MMVEDTASNVVALGDLTLGVGFDVCASGSIQGKSKAAIYDSYRVTLAAAGNAVISLSLLGMYFSPWGPVES